MGPDSRLAELDALLRQLEVRNLHKKTREFLASHGISVGQGWSRIKDAIEKQSVEASFPDLLDAFAIFVRDSVLVSYKRAYLLTSEIREPARLAAGAAEEFRKDYLSAEPPPLGADEVAWLLEERDLGRARITTFVTSRPAKKSEQLDPSSLSAELRSLYQRATLMARYDVDVRCYDHIVQVDGHTLFLLDAPEGVEASVLAKDEANYGLLLRERMPDLGTSSPIFIDLFPAVGSLWRDANEGIVNWLEFVSNNRAQISGRFSPTSRHNYREHPFQQGGELHGAQVSPYRIAVKWLDRVGEPVVLLPGKPEMVLGTGITGRSDRCAPLNYMVLPGQTSWDDFAFVLDRVRSHLKPEGSS